jgi:activating signal cointegrator complex subunit 1
MCVFCRKELLSFVRTITVLTHLYDLQERVLDVCKNSRGVDTSIFQKPEKLHLTLGTLVIMHACEREMAAKTLAECKANIIA